MIAGIGQVHYQARQMRKDFQNNDVKEKQKKNTCRVWSKELNTSEGLTGQ